MSALLAVLSTVEEFGRALLKPLGAPVGRIETFIEVPLKIDRRTIRPDGIITVSRGDKLWGALVEVKTGANGLDAQQMDAYLDLARALEFQAVLSISNEYTTSSKAYPVSLDRRKLRRLSIHHWSWIRVLTEAVVQKDHRGVKDPDQAYILDELIRYLSDPRSGVMTFDSMGPSWTAVREGARQRTLRRTDSDVEAVASRWDDLVRFLCLDLTKKLGRHVRHVVSKQEGGDPLARLQALRHSLADSGRLYADLQIPDTAGPLVIVADLAARQTMVSTRLEAPREGRSKGRVSWVLRQLQKAPGELTIEAKIARTSTSLSATLQDVRETPQLLIPEQGREIRQFVLSLSRDMGMNRSRGRGSFIDGVLSAVQDFYADVLENLSPWKAKPPRLKKGTPPVSELPAEVEERMEEPDLSSEDHAPGIAREEDEAATLEGSLTADGEAAPEAASTEEGELGQAGPPETPDR